MIEREFKLHIAGCNKIYKTTLMDLPCIIESQKTYNKNLYFKTGDISQILIVDDDNDSNNNDSNNNDNYMMDSGITPPSLNIRTRWSHVRPICEHDDSDINQYCPNCHNIPRGLINKISSELYNRIHGQASEIWELITTQEWIQVTDSESDDDDKMMDHKLENSKTLNNEWEIDEEDDEDFDIRQRQKQKEREDLYYEEIIGYHNVKEKRNQENVNG